MPMRTRTEPTSSSQYDDEGFVIPGTYAISTVEIVGAGQDGGPMAATESAVCDVCGDWASELWVAGEVTGWGDMFKDRRTSRTVSVTVYACPKHSDDVVDALVEEYGGASNFVPDVSLASKVSRAHATNSHRATEDR